MPAVLGALSGRGRRGTAVEARHKLEKPNTMISRYLPEVSGKSWEGLPFWMPNSWVLGCVASASDCTLQLEVVYI